MSEFAIIQRALITVYDKAHIIPFAKQLHLRGVELISTGNTASILKEHGLPVTLVSEYTGFPEIMQGRVKTLHPRIHGGILGRRDADADIMIAHDIPDIDLVVVNLYPFQKVTQQADCSLALAIENIDIGGPTLIRGAAKNYEWCTTIVDPQDYQLILDELANNDGAIRKTTRFKLAVKAFNHTAVYDNSIANYLQEKLPSHSAETSLGDTFSLNYQLKEHLRYGENPQQQAAFYQLKEPPTDSITGALQLQGKPLSYNNINDADTALECVKQFTLPSCVIVKHANPCGIASATQLITAYQKANQSDPTSAFGGIIAFNQTVDEQLLNIIFAKQFVEVIIAPQFTEQALNAASQKPNCRLLQYRPAKNASNSSWEIKSVNGGLLVQSSHPLQSSLSYKVVTNIAPTEQQLNDLLFSWQVVKFVKSNAIVFARDSQTLGIGAGQMSRIFSTHIATLKAQEQNFSLQNAVMASDAFFPFKDNIEEAHKHGIKAIIQPGGSMRDEEVIQAANELEIAMLFTGERYFRH